jgi:hypothetical protein
MWSPMMRASVMSFDVCLNLLTLLAHLLSVPLVGRVDGCSCMNTFMIRRIELVDQRAAAEDL